MRSRFRSSPLAGLALDRRLEALLAPRAAKLGGAIAGRALYDGRLNAGAGPHRGETQDGVLNIEEITKIGASRLERIRVRNALNPMLWLSVAVPIVILPAAWFFRDYSIVWLLVTVACLPTVTAVTAYVILLFKSPDRLQSEEYQLRQRELRMIYRHGRKPDIYNAAEEVARVEIPKSRGGTGESE